LPKLETALDQLLVLQLEPTLLLDLLHVQPPKPKPELERILEPLRELKLQALHKQRLLPLSAPESLFVLQHELKRELKLPSEQQQTLDQGPKLLPNIELQFSLES